MQISRRSILKIVAATLILSLAACGGGGADENPSVIYGWGDVDRLEVIDTVDGTGERAATGHSITIDYDGYIYDIREFDLRGAQFDSTSGGEPFEFLLGSTDVITALNQGLVGMRVGGRRTLIVPTGLAYGRQGNGPIPPNAALVFDIELLDVD